MLSAKVLDAVRRVDPDEDGKENDDDPEDTERRYFMVIDETWEKDRHPLSQCHDYGENYGAKFGNCVEDEKLADGRTDREHHAIDKECRMLRWELDALPKTALDKQRWNREQNAEEIHAAHHLKACAAVSFEDFALPVRREAVKDHVENEQKQTGEGGDGSVFALVVASTEEEDHSNGNGDCYNILVEFVLVAGYDSAHDHHGDDFARFGENLRGEADKLKSLILQPRAHNIWKRCVGILEERSSMTRLLSNE